MVASEDDNEDIGVAEGIEAIGLAIHARQLESGRRAAYFQRVSMHDGHAGGGDASESQGDERNVTAVEEHEEVSIWR